MASRQQAGLKRKFFLPTHPFFIYDSLYWVREALMTLNQSLLSDQDDP